MKEIKNMRFVDCIDLIHLGGTTDEIVNKFQKLVQCKIIDIKKLKLITIKYDTKTGDVQKAPVRVYLSNGLTIYLNLTAGYGGSGPMALCEILKICEINFNENDILSRQDVVELKYNTEPDMCYQFHNISDGTFEYSI